MPVSTHDRAAGDETNQPLPDGLDLVLGRRLVDPARNSVGGSSDTRRNALVGLDGIQTGREVKVLDRNPLALVEEFSPAPQDEKSDERQIADAKSEVSRKVRLKFMPRNERGSVPVCKAA